jgi:DNA-binding GntR family transcriptional regulator
MAKQDHKMAALTSDVSDLRSRRADQLTERAIAERITSAVMEHRLPAGTKLAENVLCDTFGTSRARIRRVLLVLAEREIVELHSNRGAFIASPTRTDARNVFQARCIIEPTIIRTAIQRLSDAQIKILRHHVEQETAAAKARNRREMIRLSGLFHVLLADFAGNPVLRRFVEDLVTRSSLIIGLFGSPHLSSCSEDEHYVLIEAIKRRDTDRAPGLMLEHLNRIERELELTGISDEAVDLREVFAE